MAGSYNNRFLLPKSIIYAYANGIKKNPPETLNKAENILVCLDYVETVNSNIKLFLKDKPRQMTIDLLNVKTEFEKFWHEIKAEGDLELALKEFDKKHNKSASKRIFWRYSLKHLGLKFLMAVKNLFKS